MLLMRTREAIMHRFRPHLRKHDLTEQQWRILRVLAEQRSAEMQALSRRCCIQAPSLSRTIPALDARGLVARRVHPSDQRRMMVELTPAGRALFKKMAAESEQIYAALTLELEPKRLARLYGLLEEVVATLEVEDTVPMD